MHLINFIEVNASYLFLLNRKYGTAMESVLESRTLGILLYLQMPISGEDLFVHVDHLTLLGI